MDKLTRMLSLLFSIYSPVTNVMAVFQWLFFRKLGRGVLVSVAVVIGILEYTVPSSTLIVRILVGVFLLALILQNLWTWATRHYTLSLLTFYPLHPWLRSCIYKRTGYAPLGDLYEVHVTEARRRGIEKKIGKSNPEYLRKLISLTAEDSKLVTNRYLALGRPFTITGVTFSDSFAHIGYRAVNSLLQQKCGGESWTPRFEQRLLYPGKKWSVYVWTDHALVEQSS